MPPGQPGGRPRGAVPELPEDPEDLAPGTAAERTRLAWERTAIAFGAVGLAMLRGEPAAGLIVLAVTPVIWGLGGYVGAGRPGARARRLMLVTAAVTGVAVLAAVAALIGHGGPVRLP